MNTTANQTAEMLEIDLKNIGWIADAPLFIDQSLLSQFYDAVVRPQVTVEKIELELTEENAKKIEKKLSGKLNAEANAGDMFKAISSFMGSYFPSLKVSGEVGKDANNAEENRESKSRTFTLAPIDTPQRQLVQLVLYYLLTHPDRLALVSNPADPEWRSDEVIKKSPRQLVFLDLPGEDSLLDGGLHSTYLLPTAAEFANGEVIPIYQAFEGEANIKYPERPIVGDEETKRQILNTLQQERKDYWKTIISKYSAKASMIAVEDAGKKGGKIRWIDYRLPIADDGTTLHLHLSPRENYDVGTFAYNLIKRGAKYGLRIIGTTKSGPDINVLAIYEK